MLFRSITDPPHPPPLAVSVKKLPSRAFFLEMNSETTAELLLNPTLTSDFIRKFNTTSTIKPNNYPIIAEFVPTSFDPTSKEGLTIVELANSLQPGDITTARWIKPPEKRMINQFTAHLILHLRSRLSANSLIQTDILLASTRVTACKLLQEAK